MPKILITGATGFVGRSLVPALLEAGFELQCALSQKADWLKAPQVLINRLEDQVDWTAVLEDIDVVIHLAARVHVMKDKSHSPLDEFCKINSTATKNLAEQAAKMGVKRFIFLSSIKVNGESTPKGMPFTEDSSPAPEDPYGVSKLLAEEHLLAISRNSSMQVVILRPPLIYGPGVKANFLKMMRFVNKGIPLPFSTLNNKRHFVNIENLVSAICKVIDHPKAANQVFLVADERSLSLPQLMNAMAEGMNTRTYLFPVPMGILSFLFKLPKLRQLNLRLLGSLEVSNNKLKTELDWIAPVGAEEGIKNTAKWYNDSYKNKRHSLQK